MHHSSSECEQKWDKKAFLRKVYSRIEGRLLWFAVDLKGRQRVIAWPESSIEAEHVCFDCQIRMNGISFFKENFYSKHNKVSDNFRSGVQQRKKGSHSGESDWQPKLFWFGWSTWITHELENSICGPQLVSVPLKLFPTRSGDLMFRFGFFQLVSLSLTFHLTTGVRVILSGEENHDKWRERHETLRDKVKRWEEVCSGRLRKRRRRRGEEENRFGVSFGSRCANVVHSLPFTEYEELWLWVLWPNDWPTCSLPTTQHLLSSHSSSSYFHGSEKERGLPVRPAAQVLLLTLWSRCLYSSVCSVCVSCCADPASSFLPSRTKTIPWSCIFVPTHSAYARRHTAHLQPLGIRERERERIIILISFLVSSSSSSTSSDR